MIKVKASGKFILLGEHFAIAGIPAIAFPVKDIWCELKLSSSENPVYRANFSGTNKDAVIQKDAVETLMARSTYVVCSNLRIDPTAQSFRIESTANFPIGRGFGSSASFAVALVRAFDEYRKRLIGENATLDELMKATRAVEKLFHGSPSGIDASTILAATPIRFESGSIVREVKNNAVDFVLVDSGSRESCTKQVQKIIELRETNKEAWGRMATLITQLVDLCEKSLFEGDSANVAHCVNTAHGILAELELSNPEIQSLIAEAKTMGALAGKVSGAGGGGAVVLVTEKNKGQELVEKLKAKGRSVVALVSSSTPSNARKG